MFISKNYPQNLNESVTIARHYGNGALEFQFKQDAQQLMHRHFQQCAQLIYLHQIPSLQTVDNRLLLFCIFYKQRLLHRLRTAFPTHHVNDIRRRRHKRSHIFCVSMCCILRNTHRPPFPEKRTHPCRSSAPLWQSPTRRP